MSVVQIVSERLLVRGVASSMIGGRAENQDDWGYMDTPLGFLVVVCDGMGGGPGGKTASYIVKNELMRVLGSCSPQMSRRQALQKAVALANDALYSKMEEFPQLKGMGSTLVAVLINEESALIVHLGDSRCYRVRGGRQVVFRTSDHSLVNELVRNKAMTEEEARTSPQSNVITRALGSTSNHTPEFDEQPFRKGDRFILCTDGIWGIMPAQELEMRFTGYPDMQSLVTNLDAETDRIGISQGGYHDNHTIAVVETMTDSRLKEKMSRQNLIIMGVLSVFLLASIVLNISLYIRNENQNGMLQAQLEKQISEVKRLQAYERRYAQLLNEGKLDLGGVINILNRENDSLRNELGRLEAELNALKQSGNKGKVKEGNATHRENTVPEASEIPDSPEAILDAIDVYVKMMIDVSGTDLKDVGKKKAQYREMILQHLDRFDGLTKDAYVDQTREIRNQLGDKGIAMLVDRPGSDGLYRSTRKAQEVLKKIRNTLKDIKENL